MNLTSIKSSFISAIRYIALPPTLRRDLPGQGVLLVTIANPGRPAETYVYVSPSWVAGLLAATNKAAVAGAKKAGIAGDTSVGRVYNRIVKHSKRVEPTPEVSALQNFINILQQNGRGRVTQ